MATIQQLWDFGGRLGHLKIRRSGFRLGTYLEVMDIRNKTVLAWIFQEGKKAKPCDTYAPTEATVRELGHLGYNDWEIYKDPPKTRKVTLYAGIVISASSYGNNRANPRAPLQYERTVSLWATAEECRAQYGDRFVKLQDHPVTTLEVQS